MGPLHPRGVGVDAPDPLRPVEGGVHLALGHADLVAGVGDQPHEDRAKLAFLVSRRCRAGIRDRL